MKLLFLPLIPADNNIICSKLNQMINDNIALVYYTDMCDIYYTCRKAKFERILGGKCFDQNKIIALAPGGVILEFGKLSAGSKYISGSKFAAPGNYYNDFIPLVLEYYKSQKVEIEDIFIVLDEDNSQYRDYHYKIDTLGISESLEVTEMNKAIEIYARENNIPYTYLYSNWSNCLSIAEKSFSTSRKEVLSLDEEILYTPFFANVCLDKNISILFTDRDGTIMTKNKEETYKNFELMKLFLETGNLIFVLTSANHTETIFHERSNFLWEKLLPYKNQIIGFPELLAGISLGGLKIPIGGTTLYKYGFVESVGRMFLNRGYAMQMFSIGDSVQDVPMILETVRLFGGIGYIINRNDGSLENQKNAPNPFTEDDWKYVESHEVPSFSDFMEQFVFPNIIDKGQGEKVKK